MRDAGQEHAPCEQLLAAGLAPRPVQPHHMITLSIYYPNRTLQYRSLPVLDNRIATRVPSDSAIGYDGDSVLYCLSPQASALHALCGHIQQQTMHVSSVHRGRTVMKIGTHCRSCSSSMCAFCY